MRLARGCSFTLIVAFATLFGTQTFADHAADDYQLKSCLFREKDINAPLTYNPLRLDFYGGAIPTAAILYKYYDLRMQAYGEIARYECHDIQDERNHGKRRRLVCSPTQATSGLPLVGYMPEFRMLFHSNHADGILTNDNLLGGTVEKHMVCSDKKID